jgi:hypothetical protein
MFFLVRQLLLLQASLYYFDTIASGSRATTRRFTGDIFDGMPDTLASLHVHQVACEPLLDFACL